MERIIYLGLLIIFFSMISGLIMFDNFSSMIFSCADAACDSSSVFFYTLFGFFIIGVFVMVDFFICLMMIRQDPWKSRQAYKKAETKNVTGMLESLEKEYRDVQNARDEAEKSYYKGNFDTQTFKKMLNSYDQRMIEIRSKINSAKKSRKASDKSKPKGEKS